MLKDPRGIVLVIFVKYIVTDAIYKKLLRLKEKEKTTSKLEDKSCTISWINSRLITYIVLKFNLNLRRICYILMNNKLCINSIIY